MPTRTELIWDGKYDAQGKRVAPLRVALPFQTVETVNESAQERDTLFQLAMGEHPWRNRLIWGDKKYVLPSLLAEFAGQVNLIYIDPPFDTGADFSFTAAVPEHDDEEENGEAIAFTKEPSIIEQKAYRDTWGRGIDSNLQWFYETAGHLHELLSETGSLYVHLDYHVSHYVKVVLDEVFGVDRFLNEISWKRTFAHGSSDRYGPVHDLVLFYCKGESPVWTDPREAHEDDYVTKHFKQIDPKTGRNFQAISLTGAGIRHGDSGKPWRGVDPTKVGRHWALPGALLAKLSIVGRTVQDKLDKLDLQGMIYWPQKSDGTPRLKSFADDLQGVAISDFWADIAPVSAQATERAGYPTQKPEALLEGIRSQESQESVNDGRKASDGRRVYEPLGKRIKQSPAEVARQRAYVEFILKLYHATAVQGYQWLHGVKNGRMIHVGAVDAPVSAGDVTQIAAEFKKAIGTGKDAPATNGVDVLGWDFAFELNEMAKQHAAAANIKMQFKRIPRDVMDKRAVEQGGVKFFELAALAVDAKTKGRAATLTLTDFVIPPNDVPEEVRAAVKHWSQWIDYWAVDWDNKGDTFHNEWQTFRTRKSPKLPLTAEHTYGEAGEYRVVVKVIDILGNDTTRTVKVKVK